MIKKLRSKLQQQDIELSTIRRNYQALSQFATTNSSNKNQINKYIESLIDENEKLVRLINQYQKRESMNIFEKNKPSQSDEGNNNNNSGGGKGNDRNS